MQLTLPLTDAPIETVTPTDSLSRSASAKRDSHRALTIGNQHTLIISCIQSAGQLGMTRHEIAEALNLPLSSVCGRVNELLNVDRPVIYISATRRQSRSVIIHRS